MSKNTQTSGLVNYIAHSGSIVSVSGSLTVTGSLNVTGGMTGSFQGVATTASYVLNAVSASFATTASYAVSASVATNAVTASYVLNAVSASFATTASYAVSASIATSAVTASYVLNAVSASFATTAVTSSFANAFTVAGTLTATTLVVQTITSSVLYSSGSNIFGNSLSNTQVMTGSVGITGSLSVIGGNVGVGIASPSRTFQVKNNSDGQTAGISGATYGIRFDNGGANSLNMSTIHGTDSTLAGSYQSIMLNGLDVRFGTSDTERMRISGSGNVIIGNTTLTNSAGYARVLNVYDASSAAVGITIPSYDYQLGVESDGALRVRYNGSARLTIASTGAATFSGSVNVNGLATSANYKLGVTGAAFISGTNNKGVFITDAASYASIVGLNSAISAYNAIEIRASGTDYQLYLGTDGRVNINTAVSSYGVFNTYKLPVASTYVDQIIVQGTGNYPSLRLGTYDLYDGVIATAGNDLRILSGLNVTTEDHNIIFYTSFNGGTTGAQNYERMRITYNGNVLVGRTSSGLTNSSGITIDAGSIQAEVNGYVFYGNRTTSDGTFIGIRRNNVDVGSISVTTSATAFNTSSDYRLKTDFKEFNALSIIDSITTYDFAWKIDNTRAYGVKAHELQNILPYVVFGEKDEINEDNSIKPQAVDYSKLVPVLVKAIQELQTRITQLENK